jgi:small subunit ribosomal protein S11
MNKKANIFKNIPNSKKIKRFNFPPKIKKKGIIHVKSSFNNTIFTLTDLKGRTKAYCSCGSAGFKGAKRSTKFAGRMAAEYLGRKTRRLGYKNVKLSLKGFASGCSLYLKAFKRSRIRIKIIKNVSSLSHNGCRPKKLRRL